MINIFIALSSHTKIIKFKISVPIWNEEFELTYRLYSVSDIQDYFEYIIKNHETVTDNPSIKVYVNKIKNIIMLKIKNVHHLEITEAVLIHCNIVNRDYQDDSRVLFTFAPNKLFGQLLDISPKMCCF